MRIVYLVPFSEAGLKNRFFEPYENPTANVPPFAYLREYLLGRGIDLKTVDFWSGKKDEADAIISFDYPPTGIYGLAYFIRTLLGKKDGFAVSAGKLEKTLSVFRKRILFQWESPVNNPWMYKSAGGFHRLFDKTYSIPDLAGAERFYYPQNFDSWNKEYFDRRRSSFLVFMNSPRRAKGFFRKELYTKREEAVSFFAELGEIDVYGGGWNGHKNAAIRNAAKGKAQNKPETFSRYSFALCFENAVWPGYLTEKIFDCLFVGTIPVYLGDPDVGKNVPAECFIDAGKFGGWNDLRGFLKSRSAADIKNYREAARSFLDSQSFKKFKKEFFAETILKSIKEA